MKPITFLGDSLDVIRKFPDESRREMGHQRQRVQEGFDPDRWKPMKSVGSSVREIRIGDETGAFRTIYVATMPESVYVLHAFQKKSRATARRDLAVARTRFRALTARRGS